MGERLTLLPDVGDLLRLSPQYNAATLVEIARVLGAKEVLWVSSLDPEHPARDAFGAAGFPIRDLAPNWAWAEAEAARFPEFLSQYPEGRERLRAAGRLEDDLRQTLSKPLTLEYLTGAEVLGTVGNYHRGVRAQLGEGPGTAHRERRLDSIAESLRNASGLAFAALDDVPDLLSRLPHAVLPDLPTFAPGESSRLRALADRALRLEDEDDLSALVEALLREDGDAVTPKAELRYAAANVYLATGDLSGARDLLEASAHALADFPRTLPGLVLARLGQVRDAQGERDLARRAYQAVQALPFAPQIALDTAKSGLTVPFQLENTEG